MINSRIEYNRIHYNADMMRGREEQERKGWN